MGSVTLRVTEEGILIPNSTARLLGCRTGDWAEVEVRPLLSAGEIRDRAIYYAVHHLGDAVLVGEGVWIDDGWRLPLSVKGREGVFGHLILSREGEVVEERSTSRVELLEAVNAARACPPPA